MKTPPNLAPGVEFLGHPVRVAIEVEPTPGGWCVVYSVLDERKRFPFASKREAFQFATHAATMLAGELAEIARTATDRPRLVIPTDLRRGH